MIVNTSASPNIGDEALTRMMREFNQDEGQEQRSRESAGEFKGR